MAAEQQQSPLPLNGDRKLEEDSDQAHIEKLNVAEAQFEIDPVIDRRVTRKFDTHIIPWLFVIWSV
jgi:hypothetical protein